MTGTANFDSAFNLVNQIFECAKTFHDTLPAEATHVYALGGSGRVQEAIDCGLCVLKQLGVQFPAKLSMINAGLALRKTTQLLKGRSMESLLRLPILNDAPTISAMHMLNLLMLYTIIEKKELAPFIGFKMVEITIKRGLCAVSSLGFCVYAMILCGIGNIDQGYVCLMIATEI